MNARGISTVVDVALCLLLVGASVGVLVAAPDTGGAPATPPSPRPTLDVLTAANATAQVAEPTRGPPAQTLAGLLATAAVLDARGNAHARTIAAVRRQIAAMLEGVSGPVQVVAAWRPHRQAAVAGQVIVGPTPPPGEDVAAASVTVPLGVPAEGGATYSASGAAIARWRWPPGPRRERGARRYTATLRSTYDTPAAAAAAIRADRVRLTVRRWSP